MEFFWKGQGGAVYFVIVLMHLYTKEDMTKIFKSFGKSDGHINICIKSNVLVANFFLRFSV